MAGLTDSVPVLCVGGIAKEFLVPGWRVGWIIVYDKHGLFAGVRIHACALLHVLHVYKCVCVRVCVPTGPQRALSALTDYAKLVFVDPGAHSCERKCL